MIFAVAGERGEARAGVLRCGEPVEVGGEPGVEGMRSAAVSESARKGMACAISTSGSVSKTFSLAG